MWLFLGEVCHVKDEQVEVQGLPPGERAQVCPLPDQFLLLFCYLSHFSLRLANKSSGQLPAEERERLPVT